MLLSHVTAALVFNRMALQRGGVYIHHKVSVDS